MHKRRTTTVAATTARHHRYHHRVPRHPPHTPPQASWPCIATVWAGHIGVVVICNSYAIRCWFLYVTYIVTLQMSNTSAKDAPASWITSRQARSFEWAAIVLVVVFVLMMIPALVATIVYPRLHHFYGYGCDRGFADYVLGCYAVAYIVLFIVFAFKLRVVRDGFRIKTELRGLGICIIIAVIPWFLFNLVFKSINGDVFPFSTLSLVVAIMLVSFMSVFLPLYSSYHQEGRVPILSFFSSPSSPPGLC